MKVIGVTGGVGAGKSTVLEILQKEYKAELLPADEIGRKLMEPGAACFDPVIKLFGDAVRRADGWLDRGKIAELVFEKEEALEQLNRIIHPAVRTEIERRLKEIEGRDDETEFAVIESAILLEAGYEEICEEIWYVFATEETRIDRLMKSRGYTRERCLHVMKNQMGEAGLRNRASAILENNSDIGQMREQIDILLKKKDRRITGAV